MVVSGVLNSWETFATKSRRTRSSFRRSVMSCSTMIAPEVSAARTAATVAAKKCWRSVPVTISDWTRGSAFRNALREHSQPVDATREGPGDQQRCCSGHEEHDQGSQPQPPAEFPHFFIHRLQGQGETKNHRGPSRHRKAHGVVQKIATDRH